MKSLVIAMALPILGALNAAAQLTAPLTLTYPGAATAVYYAGEAMLPDTPQVTGGAPLGYSVTPSLPAGFVLNSSNGILSGTPAAGSSGTYTFRASNLAGVAHAVLNITVGLKPPSNLSYSKAAFDFFAGAPVRPDTPKVTGVPTSYSVNPALPAGLILQTGKGIISGTPTAASAAKSYVITASNPAGTAQATLQIVVQPSALSPIQPEGFTCSDVSFLDRNAGFAVGWYSALSRGGTPTLAIVKTTDGGATWTDAYTYGWPGSTSSYSPDLGTIAVVNASTIYALGISGGTFNVITGNDNTVAAILKSTNGGTSWQWVNHDSIGSLNHLYFASSTLGYVSSGGLYKTFDGGVSLIPVPDAPPGSTAMTFLDASTGFLSTQNGASRAVFISRTTDGGITWNQSEAGSRRLNALAFPGGATGYAAGDSGTFRKTTDGGASWTLLPTGTTRSLHAIAFRGPDTGYVSGDSGLLLRTENGGLSWIPQVNGRTTRLGQLSFLEVNVGYACDGAILKYTGSVPVAARPAPVARASRTALRVLPGRLSFTLSSPSPVRVRLLDVRGKVLFAWEGEKEAGRHIVDLPLANRGTMGILDFRAGALRETVLIPAR